eukprot:TRINITY_DN19799_c0_g1_i3.p1 TRINITY_DN19799_c0_g1~~TRINITY_DN19799_c0_g1_i3.p1  ORF type:complete len:694 (+),score=146.19 TRINITY_DN19799_c0_g1_i3:96-2177(+)
MGNLCCRAEDPNAAEPRGHDGGRNGAAETADGARKPPAIETAQTPAAAVIADAVMPDVGAVVQTAALSKAELNGLLGTVTRRQGDRAVVHLPEPYGERALRPANVKVIRSAPELAPILTAKPSGDVSTKAPHAPALASASVVRFAEAPPCPVQKPSAPEGGRERRRFAEATPRRGVHPPGREAERQPQAVWGAPPQRFGAAPQPPPAPAAASPGAPVLNRAREEAAGAVAGRAGSSSPLAHSSSATAVSSRIAEQHDGHTALNDDFVRQVPLAVRHSGSGQSVFNPSVQQALPWWSARRQDAVLAYRPALNYNPDGFLPLSEGSTLAVSMNQEVQIIRYLGNGSFGSVWRARQLGVDSEFALKIGRAGPVHNEHCRHEHQLLRKLHKARPADRDVRGYAKRIMEVLHTFEMPGPHGNHVCVAMPLMGADLYHLRCAHSGRGVAPEIAQVVAKQILQGLAFLAGAGYVHCDIKPANVLLGRHCLPGTPASDGAASGDDLLRGHYQPPRLGETLEECLLRQYSLRLSDLGSCKKVQGQEERSAVLLTVEYRPPEVLAGARRVYPAVDIWAAGCTVYELATGQYLFWLGEHADAVARDRAHWAQLHRCFSDPPPSFANPAKYDFCHTFFDSRKMLRDRPLDTEHFPIHRRLAQYCPAQYNIKLLESFLDILLRYDPAKRWNAQRALRHSWLEVRRA